jgi:hypothetical protein
MIAVTFQFDQAAQLQEALHNPVLKHLHTLAQG